MPINIPFLLHILGELSASAGFFLRPSQTLRKPQPEAHAVIRQYALLLTSTNLIAAIFLFQGHATVISAKVAGALALYHLGPLTRAAMKVRTGEKMGIWEGVGGAWVHVRVMRHLMGTQRQFPRAARRILKETSRNMLDESTVMSY